MMMGREAGGEDGELVLNKGWFSVAETEHVRREDYVTRTYTRTQRERWRRVTHCSRDAFGHKW